MILKASQRAGAKALAIHLLRLDENDHVHVHEVKGFVSDNVLGALQEAYAVSRGTKCKQFLFSLSLSPPATETVPTAVFEAAINRIEARLDIIGQPRVVVFHEKDGRRHAHCVWSRIDSRSMTAKTMGHFKVKLTELARELYLEHGWKMPQGFVNSEEANPLNFSQAEWQQAKRIERDPKRIKDIFQQCWASSDSPAALSAALEARGYYLARGDRRGIVAVDWRGEIYALARWSGVRTKDVQDRMGDALNLPTVGIVTEMIAQLVAQKEKAPDDIGLDFDKARLALKEHRNALVAEQRIARSSLTLLQARRRDREAVERSSRLRKGIKGIWDWMTGKRAQIMARNEAEIALAKLRDEAEFERLINEQLKVRRELQGKIDPVSIRIERRNEVAQQGPTMRMRGQDVPSLVVGVSTLRRRGPTSGP